MDLPSAEVFGNQAAATVTSGGGTAPASGTPETWTASTWAAFTASTGSSQCHIYDETTGKSSELILVTNISGTSASVIRGAGGTTPVAHSAPFTVTQAITANWLNAAVIELQPTGDATGALDTAFVSAAIAQLGSQGGTVRLAPGVFYWICGSVIIAQAQVYIQGAGWWSTLVSAVGSGDTIRMYNPAGSGTTYGGGVKGLTIDGTNAGTGSTGLHIGDGSNYALDVAVQNFSGTSCIGVHFDNTIWWTEKIHGIVYASNNTQNVVFDVSSPATTVASGSNGGEISQIASWGGTFGGNGVLDVASTAGYPASGTVNVAASGATTAVVTFTGITSSTLTGCAYVSGSATGTVATGGAVTLATSTISFGYIDLDIWVNATGANQDGVVLQNGARIYHGALAIRGNFTGSSSAQSSYVLRLTGTAPAGHLQAGAGSQIIRSRLDITVEANGASHAPGTIFFGTSAVNVIEGCYGVMDFGSGGISFTQSNLGIATNANTLQYSGIINGDNNLNPASITLPISVGGHLYSQSTASGANGNIFVVSGDFFAATLSASITVNLNASTNVNAPRRITIIYTQAASGGPFTVTWPHSGSPTTSSPTVLWAGGSAPTMSTGAGAVDVYDLETVNGATWYGRATQNVS